MSDTKVLVYSLSTCGHCKDTIAFIKKMDVDFSFIDIDRLEKTERKRVLEEVRKVNPECSFPTTVAGDRIVVGYNEKELEEALNS